MLFLATVFPVPLDEDDDDLNAEVPFDFLMEFWKLTVDLADLIGLYVVIQKVAGKGQVKVLTAGLGWAFAELVLTRVIFLWVGARGIEFDWKYIQNSFEANISLLHHITLAALVWLWTRREIQKSVVPVLLIVGLVCSYKGLILDLLVHNFALGTWYGFGPVVKSKRVLSPFFSLSVSFAPTKVSSWICLSTILPWELGPHLFIRLCRLLVSV